MKPTLKMITQWIWLLVGLLACAVLVLAVTIGIDVRETVKDMHELWTEVTVEDVRQGLRLMEKQLDIDLGYLEIEKQLSGIPLEFTAENWQAFLDFCARTGYIVSDENWQRFRYGKLKP